MKKYFFLTLFFVGITSIFAQPIYFDVKKEVHHSGVGVAVGSGIVFGEIAFAPGFQAGLFLNKRQTYWLDWRVGAGMYNYSGLDTKGDQNITNNEVINGSLTTNYLNQPFYFNYKTRGVDAYVAARFKPIQIFNKKYDKGFDIGVLTGLGLTAFETYMNVLNKDDQKYAFTANMSASEIKGLLDDSYESAAQTDNTKIIFGRYTRSSYLVGGFNLRGVLAPKFALGLDLLAKYTFTDLLDGQQWKFDGKLSESRDMIFQGNVTLEYLFGQ